MGEKLLTLEEWATEVYGKHPPALVTLRRWAREGRIHPTPEKHGRAYFVRADAQYVDTCRPGALPRGEARQRPAIGRLVERIRHGKTAQR